MIILIDDLFVCTGNQKDILVSEIEKTGYQVIVSKYIRNIKDFEDTIPTEETLLLYGSIQFVEDALKRFPNAVSFYSKRLFECSYFMSHIDLDLFLNSDAKFFPLGFLKQYFATRSRSTSDPLNYFVRSNSGRKTFAGKLIPREEMTTFYSEGLSIDSMVVVAPEKETGQEYRFFIRGRKIVSYCATHRNGEPIEHEKTSQVLKNPGIEEFAEMVANQVADKQCMDEMYVCDICAIGYKNYKIVEFNAASTSDLHYCEITKVFNAMAEVINKEQELSE